MEGCAREVRGLGEDGGGGEERDNGRHDIDNVVMTMNNDHAAIAIAAAALKKTINIL
jgi:hypothetical protein